MAESLDSQQQKCFHRAESEHFLLRLEAECATVQNLEDDSWRNS